MGALKDFEQDFQLLGGKDVAVKGPVGLRLFLVAAKDFGGFLHPLIMRKVAAEAMWVRFRPAVLWPHRAGRGQVRRPWAT